MTSEAQAEKSQPPTNINQEVEQKTKTEQVLCPHCLRTASNGIKCKGICVADSDY